jgi:hypothetical protein
MGELEDVLFSDVDSRAMERVVEYSNRCVWFILISFRLSLVLSLKFYISFFSLFFSFFSS